MATAAEFLARMIAGLRLQRPDWEVIPGTPEYSLLEVVALEEERLSQDSLLNDYHWDIDAKSGAALDSFVRLFGFERIPGSRATGVVTFSRGSAAPQNYFIPVGTQVYVPASTTDIATFFRTVVPAFIEAGATSADIAVEATIAGAFGNVDAGAINALRDAVPGVTSVSNALAFSGGADPELDSALRTRWRQTLFRNLAGTESYYLARVFADAAVGRAIVIGPQSTFEEQLTLATGAATSQIVAIGRDAKYVYPYSSFMGYHVGQADEMTGVRALVGANGTNDFFLSTAIPPVLTINNAVKFPDGMIVDLEYDYTAKSSRNDPSTGVLDKVDIFVAAELPTQVTEQVQFSTAAGVKFQDGTAGTIDRTLYRRADGSTSPTSGNFFTKMYKVPLVSLPDTITIGGVVYVKNVDYWEVFENVQGGTRFSPRALDGIEWLSTANGAGAGGTQAQVTSGTQVTVRYFYNSVVDRIDNIFDRERRVGQDVLVHRGQFRRLRFNLAIMFARGSSISQVTTDVATALQTWLAAKDFRDNVQIADIIEVAGQVSGVDNIRVLGSTEGVATEQQRLVFNGAWVDNVSTFRVKVGTETTAAITYSATAATRSSRIQAALEALVFVDPGDVTVASTNAPDIRSTITFQANGTTGLDRWGNRNVDMVQVTGITGAGTGTVTITEVQKGQGYGLETFARDGMTITSRSVNDIYLASDAVPVFHSVVLVPKTRNTW